jgi:DNA-binding transcriptional regulator YiaG
MTDNQPAEPGQPGFVRGNERLDQLLADPQLAADVAAAHVDAEEMDRVNAMNLAMIRKAAQMTQVEVARKLGVGQGVVSRLEHRDDMLLSTLYDYLMATGAEGASIVVVVHGHRIELDLSGFHNAPPEQQSALSSHRPGMCCCLGVSHVTAYGQGQSDYARLQPWITACHPHGTFRGTVFWLISAQRVPSVRLIVPTVQLACVLHGAVLLVNGRSAVRSRSPAPKRSPALGPSAARDEAAAPGPEQLSAQTRAECSFRQLGRPWRGARGPADVRLRMGCAELRGLWLSVGCGD